MYLHTIFRKPVFVVRPIVLTFKLTLDQVLPLNEVIWGSGLAWTNFGIFAFDPSELEFAECNKTVYELLSHKRRKEKGEGRLGSLKKYPNGFSIQKSTSLSIVGFLIKIQLRFNLNVHQRVPIVLVYNYFFRLF
jgi:hypothetical protein